MVFQKEVRAMNTLFSIRIPGNDLEKAEEIATEMEAEIHRVERLLSRFDPRAELYRINQSAYRETLKISPELMGILMDAKMAWETTGFGFNAAWRSGLGMDALKLDPRNLLVRFNQPDLTLDLGGYGKGYAVDQCRQIFQWFNHPDGFMDAGGSSGFALGTREGEPWELNLNLEYQQYSVQKTYPLKDIAYSCSTHRKGDLEIAGATSEGCVLVMCADAVEAELFSTSALVLGMDKTREKLRFLDPDNPEEATACYWFSFNPGGIEEQILMEV